MAGSGITIERLGPNESADVPSETVRYEDLSPRGREVFDEALADLRNGSSEVHPDGVGTFGAAVVHEGTRYGVVVFSSVCGAPGVVFLLGGVAASVVGLVAFALAALLSWRRA
ncbi:hypothetical protein [Halomarina litorea]|uniref:hypothetical protein n=1 Tax=Halomarina litorea TaxID=2961595 RepID=UPI0020C5060E|nr:hypothetical protein [Halomarina sp. BCD28]